LLMSGGFQIIKRHTASWKSKLSTCDKPDLLLHNKHNSQLCSSLFSCIVQTVGFLVLISHLHMKTCRAAEPYVLRS
jgi:hypothetical protein